MTRPKKMSIMKYMLISGATTKGNSSKYTIMYCDSSQHNNIT